MTNAIFKVQARKEISNGLKIVEVAEGSLNKSFLIASADRYTSLAIEFTIDEDGSYKIKPKGNYHPTLFADFPLVGSHEFIFPGYLNSHLFWPNEERSSILLQFGSHAGDNQRVMKQAVEMFKLILNHTIKYKWKNIE